MWVGTAPPRLDVHCCGVAARYPGAHSESRLANVATPAHPLPVGAQDGRTLWFKGAGKEAMAVICRSREGGTTIVLNTVIYMEHVK